MGPKHYCYNMHCQYLATSVGARFFQDGILPQGIVTDSQRSIRLPLCIGIVRRFISKVVSNADVLPIEVSSIRSGS
jgi:hypothetical protein